MTERNDKAFAAFLMKFAQRVYEADKHNINAREEQRRAIDELSSYFSSGGYANVSTPTSNAAIKQKAANQIAQLATIAAMQSSMSTVSVSSHTHSLFGSEKSLIEQSDLEIIRAYFEGEDVVVTLLAQAR